MRYTPGRRTVVAGISSGDGPMTVSELQAATGEAVPLSSLYRTLSVMSEAGVLSTHHSAEGLTRYELAEWLTGHHHHLVCITCGSVDDIEIAPEHEERLERLVEALAARSRFVPNDHSLEIDGECWRCRQ